MPTWAIAKSLLDSNRWAHIVDKNEFDKDSSWKTVSGQNDYVFETIVVSIFFPSFLRLLYRTTAVDEFNRLNPDLLGREPIKIRQLSPR